MVATFFSLVASSLAGEGPPAAYSDPSVVYSFAQAVEKNMQRQLEHRVRPGTTCLVTALEDVDAASTATTNGKGGNGTQKTNSESFDGWMSYLVRHEIFVKALQRLHGGSSFNMTLIVLARDGKALKERHQSRLKRAYANTLFVSTLLPPKVIAEDLGVLNRTYLQSGVVDPIISAETVSQQLFFYSRLQMFAMTPCANIIAIDTGDMLPRLPFIDDALAVLSESSDASTPAAASPATLPQPSSGNVTAWRSAIDVCRASYDFAAPRICSQDVPYINGGFFTAARSCLGAAPFAGLILMALVPPRPSLYQYNVWTSDQDTINVFFDAEQHTRMPSDFSCDKRYMNHPNCQELSPRIIHYVGTKPSMPHDMRDAQDLGVNVLNAERLWWSEYLADKAVVVGSGPSLHAPLGQYIDLFGQVLRVNNFAINDADATGVRVTEAFVHPATLPPVGYSLSDVVSNASRVHVELYDFNATSGQERMLLPETGCGLVLGDQATVLPEWYHEGLSTELHLKPGTHATIGILAMAWAQRNVNTRPIFAVGLDMSCGPDPPEPESDYTHADGSTTSVSSLEDFHDVVAEWKWMQPLITKEDVIVLDVALGETSIPPPPSVSEQSVSLNANGSQVDAPVEAFHGAVFTMPFYLMVFSVLVSLVVCVLCFLQCRSGAAGVTENSALLAPAPPSAWKA